jgi:tRNA A-37 threonylcarbamoyl transferase component Bud32
MKSAGQIKSKKNDATVTYDPPAAGKDSPLPARIGRFQILGLLGEGAFGRVYKARDPQLDRDVAIKVPKPDMFASAQDRERFLREARAAAGVQHPNICPVHDVVLDDDNVYIVMTYVRGQSLADYLAEKRNVLNAKQAVLIARKLALALHAAHAKGIVHRDLKPGNILFDADRKDVVISDFGLARRSRSADAELTRNGVVMGTPAYMSPEQARGDNKQVGPASDIHALGAILYELLTGTRPFTGSVGEVLGKVQHVEPEAPSKLKPGLDRRLDKICLKVLAKSPENRFASMREFASHLGAYLKDVPSGAVASGAPPEKAELGGPSEASQMADIIAALSVERKAAAQSMERSQKSMARAVVAVGLCLGLLLVLAICTAGGVGAWLYWRGGDALGGPVVSVTLQNITHLHDNSVHYWLDGKQIDSKSLEGPIKLSLGNHELVGKRGNDIVEQRSFRVGAEDANTAIVPLLAEPGGPAGLIREWKHGTVVSSIDVSPDGRWVVGVHASFGRNGHSDSLVGVWEIDTGKAVNPGTAPGRRAGGICTGRQAPLPRFSR